MMAMHMLGKWGSANWRGLGIAGILLAIGGTMLYRQWHASPDSMTAPRASVAGNRAASAPSKPIVLSESATFGSLRSPQRRVQSIQERIAGPEGLPLMRLAHRWINPDRLGHGSTFRFNWLPPPGKIQLAWAGNRLWFSNRSYGDSYRMARECAFKMYEPATDSIIDLSRSVCSGSPINDMTVEGKYVWLATEKGMVRIETGTLEIKRYEMKQGSADLPAGTVAAANGGLMVGGNGDEWSLLRSGTDTFMNFDPGMGTGKSPQSGESIQQRIAALRHKMAGESREARRQTMRQIIDLRHQAARESQAATMQPQVFRYRHFVSFHDWLIFDSDQVRFFNLKTHEMRLASKELADLLKSEAVSQDHLKIDGYMADSKAIWMTSGSKLIRLDPDAPKAQEWTLPGKGPYVLATDGDFLWIAYSGFYSGADFPQRGATIDMAEAHQPAQRAESWMMLWHIPSEKWIGSFRLEGTVQSICPASPMLWVGLGDTQWPLVAVDTRDAYKPFTQSTPAPRTTENRVTSPLAQTGATPAILAAYAGDLNFIEQCDQQDLDSIKGGWNPLLAAAAGGQAEVVQWLLKHGANAGQTPLDGTTISPLYLASAIGNEASIKALIDSGANVDEALERQGTPLLVAADSGNLAAAKLLLDKGANPLSIVRWFSINSLSAGQSPLTRAAERNDCAMAQLILQRRSAGPWEDGTAALSMAIRHGNQEMVHLLLEAGIAPGSLDKLNHAPMEWAVLSGNRIVVDDLIRHGARPDYCGQSRNAPLLLACRMGDLQMARHLIDSGANVNLIGDESRIDLSPPSTVLVTPFILAAQRHDGPTMQYLLDHGCNLNLKIQGVRQGDLALVAAGGLGHMDVVRLLIGRGFDLNARDHMGQTALWIAATNYRSPAMSALLEAGADPRIEGPGGQSLLKSDLGTSTARLLKKYIPRDASPTSAPAPADPNAKDNDGWPMIVLAAANGNAKETAALIQAKVNVDAQGPGEWTALMQACKHGNVQIARMLIQAGANLQMQNMLGRTACDIATDYHQSEALAAMKDAGALHGDGRALIRAAWQSNLMEVYNLLQAGANIDAVDQTGRTALFYALDRQMPPHSEIFSYPRDPWVAKLLIGSGADVNHRDKQGRTPLMAALTTDRDLQPSPELIELLVRQGATVDRAGPDSQIISLLIGQIPSHEDRKVIEQLLQRNQ